MRSAAVALLVAALGVSAQAATPMLMRAKHHVCSNIECPDGRSREFEMLNPMVAATEGIALHERDYVACSLPRCSDDESALVRGGFQFRESHVVRLPSGVEIEATPVVDDSGRNTVTFKLSDATGQHETVSITPLLEVSGAVAGGAAGRALGPWIWETQILARAFAHSLRPSPARQADNSTMFAVQVGDRFYETEPGFEGVQEDLAWVIESFSTMSARLQGLMRRYGAQENRVGRQLLSRCGWFGWGNTLAGCGFGIAGCASVVTVVGGVICAGAWLRALRPQRHPLTTARPCRWCGDLRRRHLVLHGRPRLLSARPPSRVASLTLCEKGTVLRWHCTAAAVAAASLLCSCVVCPTCPSRCQTPATRRSTIALQAVTCTSLAR